MARGINRDVEFFLPELHAGVVIDKPRSICPCSDPLSQPRSRLVVLRTTKDHMTADWIRLLRGGRATVFGGLAYVRATWTPEGCQPDR